MVLQKKWPVKKGSIIRLVQNKILQLRLFIPAIIYDYLDHTTSFIKVVKEMSNALCVIIISSFAVKCIGALVGLNC